MITVSIIEDDKNYRETLEDLINNSKEFRLLYSYSSGESAIPHILEHKPQIAIVDIKLPGKSGIEIISIINQQAPDLPCMVCSFYDDNEHVFDALKNGASGYLLKDSLPDEIINSLRELYAGGAPMSRYIARKVIGAFQPGPTNHRNLSELTERENEVLQQLATGKSVREVSEALFLSPHTIAKHLKKIYHKLHVNNRVEAVNKLQQPGK